jgi:PST family polysaccharide transporter
MGAMSLAVGMLASTSVGAVLFYKFAPEALRFGFNRAKARELLKFGLPLAGSSIVVFANTNVDRLLVGVIFGPVALGFYALALNLSNLPVNIFSFPVRSVAPAALARLQGDRTKMNQTFLTTAGLLAAVTLPVCVLLAATSFPGVRFIYGLEWEKAAAVLPWLALLGALKILYELIYDYFVVLASTRVVFTVQVIWLVALIPALYAGSTLWGLQGAGVAQFAVALVVVLPIYLWELNKAGIAPGALGSAMLMPVAISVAVAGMSLLAGYLIDIDFLVLAVAGLAGLGAIGALIYRMRGAMRALRSMEAPSVEPEPAVLPTQPTAPAPWTGPRHAAATTD